MGSTKLTFQISLFLTTLRGSKRQN